MALPAGDTIALAYDAASRITGMTETGQPVQNFGYDALDRLATYASGAATQTYTYDANGNRASYLDNATQPVSLSYNIDPASNRLIGIGGSWAGSFTYDASGNMLSYSTPYSGYSFSYDARNRQAQAYVGAIGTGWLINGLGQRIGQMNGAFRSSSSSMTRRAIRPANTTATATFFGRRRGSAICRPPRALRRGSLLSRRII